MHTFYKRLTALLLTLLLLLGLAACGGKDGEDADTQLTGTVYVPQFMDLNIDLGKNGHIVQGCTDGRSVYVLAAIYPDWEAGEEGDTRYEIYRVPLDGGTSEKLENFQLPPTPEGYDSAYVYANNLRAGAEGTLWAAVSISAVKYDLPEDFDPENDYMWNYSVLENLDAEYQVQLDSTGNEISRVDTSGLREKLSDSEGGMVYISSDAMLFDRDGDLYVGMDGKIVVLDPSMNVRFTLEDESIWGDTMVLLSDGSVGARLTVRDVTNDTYSRQLRVIDKAAKNWGTGYDLPSDAYNIYPGGGDYLFYYKNGENIYGMRDGGEEGEKLFNWLESDINSNEVEFFSFLPGGQVVVMTRSWSSRRSDPYQLALLTETDRSELPEKTVLTYATMYLGYDERTRILDFNRNNPTYRIEVRDYSEFNTDEDYMAGSQKLNTEIIAGTVPDIISIGSGGLPLRQYGAKGYLEDLWPFIENDPDLGRDALMERVFAAAEQDGKLYQIFDTFNISTVLGATSVVGDRMSWKLEDLRAALETMPEGCAIFGQYDSKDTILSNVLMMNLDGFVDWDNGTCNFDSPEFKSLLAFCDSFPAESNWESGEYDDEPTRVTEGRQMLMNETVSNFQDIQMHKAIFGGSVSYVGYPMEDGGVGSSFSTYGGLAMSSTCADKEGAWTFLRQLLLPQYADDEDTQVRGMSNAFSTNKADFERIAKDAMTPSGYETDENGELVLDENGDPIETSNWGWGWGSIQIDVYSTKQEEYDQIMALYNAVDRMAGSDESILEIVRTEAGAYFAGDRTLDDTAALIQNRANIYINEQR